MTVIVAADPGTTGCIAALCSTRGVLDIARVPVVNRSKGGAARNFVCGVGLRDMLKGWSSRHRFAAESVVCVIERVSVMAGGENQRYAGGQLMHAAGVIEGVLSCVIGEPEFVTPNKWLGYYGLGGKRSSKAASVEVARRLYPDLPRVFGHDKAEAVLIAHWMLSQVNGEARAA